MGYNRGGRRRNDRLKRRKRHEQRLAAKVAEQVKPATGGAPGQPATADAAKVP
jgi:hypothetical protein